MDITTYCAKHGAKTELAQKLGLPSQLIWQWARRVRPVPVERCISIEKATDGAVTCEELRPDIDWPYLRGTEKHADGTTPTQEPAAQPVGV